MSYCRTGEDSDVYVIGSFEALECMCSLNEPVPGFDAPRPEVGDDPSVWSDYFMKGWRKRTHILHEEAFLTTSRKAMISHLEDHLFHGDRVPMYALDRLLREYDQGGDEY